MQIKLIRINEDVHLKALNERGNEVLIDGSPDVGGKDLGVRPMELLLVAIGSCASMDLLHILKKQRQIVEDYDVIVNGEREKQGDVSLFKTIHMEFILKGKLDEEKVKHALFLAVEKYCSVAKTLEHTAKISYSYKIIL
ncbi:MAG: OsmC family protein [Bacteroidia bacterium]